MFFGQIRSTLKCIDCLQESPTYEGFSNLSLELPVNNKEYDLYDCLDSYFDGEYIDGWLCPKCEKNRRAIKKLDISKLPEILVIHLKRFVISCCLLLLILSIHVQFAFVSLTKLIPFTSIDST